MLYTEEAAVDRRAVLVLGVRWWLAGIQFGVSSSISPMSDANGSRAVGCGVRGPWFAIPSVSGLTRVRFRGGSGDGCGYTKSEVLLSRRTGSVRMPIKADCEETLLFFFRNTFLVLFLFDIRLIKPAAGACADVSLIERTRPSELTEYTELTLPRGTWRLYGLLTGPDFSPFTLANSAPMPLGTALNLVTKLASSSFFSLHPAACLDLRFRMQKKIKVASNARPITPPTTPPTIPPMFGSFLLPETCAAAVVSPPIPPTLRGFCSSEGSTVGMPGIADDAVKLVAPGASVIDEAARAVRVTAVVWLSCWSGSATAVDAASDSDDSVTIGAARIGAAEVDATGGAAASSLSEFVGDGLSGVGDSGAGGAEGAEVEGSGACACASGAGDSAGDSCAVDVGPGEGAADRETVGEDVANEDTASEEATTA